MTIQVTFPVLLQMISGGSLMMPEWLLSIIISVMIALITSVAVMSATKANLEVRAKRNEDDIKSLQNEKVNKSEFQLVYDILIKIEKKIEEHIKET